MLTTEEFINLVKEMRSAQRTYFATRDGDAKKLAIKLEKRVDEELYPSPKQQQTLF